MKKRVVLAMSGGVDSSCSAYILKNMGYDVIGITFKIWKCSDDEEKKKSCCSLKDLLDAQNVAINLGITHFTLEAEEEFKKIIIDYFCEEYSNGRTPNPCIVCNHKFKFPKLLKLAQEIGADYIATGHYAIIDKFEGEYVIKKAKDKSKDQSYFLFGVDKKILPKIIFPLGNLKKVEVRKIAKDLGLKVADKKESQEVCFYEKKDKYNFIRKTCKKGIEEGDVFYEDGNFLGKHKGIAFYTIGQRKGFGIANKIPLYVIEIKPKENIIILGQEKSLYKKELIIDNLNIISNKLFDIHENFNVRIRYKHKESKAKLIKDGKLVKVIFNRNQRAITPGQGAAIYFNDILVGGGFIR